MLLLLLAASLVSAPAQRPESVVKWSADAVTPAATPGKTVEVKVSARVQRGWKLYALQQPEDGPKPLSFETAAGSPFEVVVRRIAAPRPKVQARDVNFAVDTRYYEGDATFSVPVMVAPTARSGDTDIPLEVTFQACGAELCLRPFTQRLPVRITIAK